MSSVPKLDSYTKDGVRKTLIRRSKWFKFLPPHTKETKLGKVIWVLRSRGKTVAEVSLRRPQPSPTATTKTPVLKAPKDNQHVKRSASEPSEQNLAKRVKTEKAEDEVHIKSEPVVHIDLTAESEDEAYVKPERT